MVLVILCGFYSHPLLSNSSVWVFAIVSFVSRHLGAAQGAGAQEPRCESSTAGEFLLQPLQLDCKFVTFLTVSPKCSDALCLLTLKELSTKRDLPADGCWRASPLCFSAELTNSRISVLSVSQVHRSCSVLEYKFTQCFVIHGQVRSKSMK